MTPPVPHRSVTTVLTLVVPLALATVPFVVASASGTASVRTVVTARCGTGGVIGGPP